MCSRSRFSPLIGQGQAVGCRLRRPHGRRTTPRPSRTPSATTPPTSPPAPATSRPSPTTPPSPTRFLASWSLTPTGLAVGTKFRLLFLSSTKRDALSSDIADYNTFVQDRAAAGHADIQAYSGGFGAIGCTAAVDARDNTSTTGTGVPIYWAQTAPRSPTTTRISTTGPGTTRSTTRTSPAPTRTTPPRKTTTPSPAAWTTAPNRSRAQQGRARSARPWS